MVITFIVKNRILGGETEDTVFGKKVCGIAQYTRAEAVPQSGLRAMDRNCG